MAWLTPEEVLRTPDETLGLLILHKLGGSYGFSTLNFANFRNDYLSEHAPRSSRGATVIRHDALQADNAGLTARLTEAWAWLEQQRYLIPDPQQRTGSHFRSISDRGREVLTVPVDDALRRIRAGHLLGKHLHPRIEAQVRGVWNAGDFETAILKAGREVEIAVGEAIGSAKGRLYGKDVMNAAFGAGKLLTDPSQDPGEQEGTRALYAGFIATFKNPGSHRHFEPSDPVQAAEIITTADLLIRMLEDRLAEVAAESAR